MFEAFQFLLPLATLAIGWFFARSREREKDRQDKRLMVYADMLAVMAMVERQEFIGVSNRVFKGEDLHVNEQTYFNNILESYNRTHLQMMVFGSPKVIEAVSNLYNYEGEPLSEEWKTRYVAVLNEMRSDGFQKSSNEFHKNVDNILLSGPVARRERMFAKNRLQSDEATTKDTQCQPD